MINLTRAAAFDIVQFFRAYYTAGLTLLTSSFKRQAQYVSHEILNVYNSFGSIRRKKILRRPDCMEGKERRLNEMTNGMKLKRTLGRSAKVQFYKSFVANVTKIREDDDR